jgi:Dolichyl-phosphate-mannose-protein mannosyltransferase
MASLTSPQVIRDGAVPRVLVGAAPRALLRGVGVLGLLTAIVVFLTWPLATDLTQTLWHIDPPFSAWRLAWVSHQLFIDPAHLFDGNQFYPAPRTLAYSDAMLFQGLLAIPLIKGGMPPLIVMNLFLFGGIVLSGGGMYLLARRLTGDTAAALLAAIVFSFAPYRADHLMHLELQWAMFIPLTLWAFHRTLREGRLRDGVLTGVFLLLQLLCSIYYALFLASALTIVGGASLVLQRRQVTRRMLGGFAIGGLIFVAIAVPYSKPYRDNVHDLGLRPPGEIKFYSATPTSYLSVTPDNAMLGPYTGSWSDPEKRLFPGGVAILLVVLAFVPPICSVRWLYLAVLAFAVEASFGLNGRLYPLMHEYLRPFQGLRVPGRFGILVLLAVGVLAAYGAAWILRRTPTNWRRPLTVLLGGVMVLEYQLGPQYMEALPIEKPAVYRWLAREPKTVTIELPTPDPGSLPFMDPFYLYFSVMHWQPLVNGYSGHYAPSYIRLLHRLRKFPDEQSVDALRQHGVNTMIVHAAFYEKEKDYAKVIAFLGARSDVRLIGVWRDHVGEARAYRLSPQ